MNVVYVVYSKSQNAVKIGYTSNLSSRFSTLQISTAEKLELLMTLTGGKELELKIHGDLKLQRLSGEWFICNKTVLDYLQQLQSDFIFSTVLNLNPVFKQNQEIIKLVEDYFTVKLGRPRTRIPLRYLRDNFPLVDLAHIKTALHEAGYPAKKDSNGVVHFYRS